MRVAGSREGKEQCRALALQLVPACSASFARVKDAGRAEAALLALYATTIRTQPARSERTPTAVVPAGMNIGETQGS